MNKLLIVASFYLSLLVSWAGAAWADQVITLDTRPGVKQSFLLIEPPGEVKGVMMMFPGHEGVVNFVKGEEGYQVNHDGGGFTVKRNAIKIFQSYGLVMALVAPPTDRERGMDTRFRSSNEHLADIRSVIGYLKAKYNREPYLHGHCRSTFSPASITTLLKNEGIAGMILSSPRSTGGHGAVMDYQAGMVSVPVLLVQHTQDPCPGTSYQNIQYVRKFYEQSSRKVDLILVTGGDIYRKREGASRCQVGAHAFAGLEEETANAIAGWILGREYPQHIEK
jgi:hypothetical protein